MTFINMVAGIGRWAAARVTNLFHHQWAGCASCGSFSIGWQGEAPEQGFACMHCGKRVN